ncbi:hypothetical protein ABEG63_04150 [Chryseobacterium sp. C39-AII1]|uniref:hypothetical protein n=1 Tax=Chryseobacterium sp. C39-AII1 TaxID=3080332 RepID=UPI00320ADCDB
MKNYRKLLFAAFGIIPLALSSWTSEDPIKQYQVIDNQSKVSSVGTIGTSDYQSEIIVQSKKDVLVLVDRYDYVDKVVITTKILEPTTSSVEDIIKTYQ